MDAIVLRWTLGAGAAGVAVAFGLWMWLEGGAPLAELGAPSELVAMRFWLLALVAPFGGFVGYLIGLERAAERRESPPRRF